MFSRSNFETMQGTASNHQWNLFNFAINKSQDVRHRKFLVRMRFYPEVDDPVLLTMVGHVTCQSTSYYHSADSYNEGNGFSFVCSQTYTHI